jgi:hypothetical protein
MKYKIGAMTFAYVAVILLSIVIAVLFGKPDYAFGIALVVTGLFLAGIAAVLSARSLMAASNAVETTVKSNIEYFSTEETAQRIVSAKNKAYASLNLGVIYLVSIASFALATFICYWDNGRYGFPLDGESLYHYGFIFFVAVVAVLLNIIDTLVRILVSVTNTMLL